MPSKYFAVFPLSILHEGSLGFDLGCGSVRRANFVVPRAGRLHYIDSSESI